MGMLTLHAVDLTGVWVARTPIGGNQSRLNFQPFRVTLNRRRSLQQPSRVVPPLILVAYKKLHSYCDFKYYSKGYEQIIIFKPHFELIKGLAKSSWVLVIWSIKFSFFFAEYFEMKYKIKENILFTVLWKKCIFCCFCYVLKQYWIWGKNWFKELQYFFQKLNFP